jgi:16S rRNA (uracil1498-N3)-methyltransferase
MARRLFFVTEVRRGLAELHGEDAEHLVRVLRAEAGQTYEISDNRKRYLARIETARKSLVSFQVVEELPDAPRAAEVHLFPALFKFDRFEWLIEKATELGVSAIHPIEATRSEHGLARAAVKRAARWQRIALEASQQSRRTHLPELHGAASLHSVSRTVWTVPILLDEDVSAPPITTVIDSICPQRTSDQSVGFILGPEGGWTPEERRELQEGGWHSASLGHTVLRAETAGLAAVSIANALWQR